MCNVCDFWPELPRIFNYKKLHAMLTLDYKQMFSSQIWWEYINLQMAREINENIRHEPFALMWNLPTKLNVTLLIFFKMPGKHFRQLIIMTTLTTFPPKRSKSTWQLTKHER